MKAIAGGIVALVLLAFYVLLVYSAIQVVGCVTTAGCTGLTAASFNDVKSQAMSVLGGLVSALIIAELAITKPGEEPGVRILSATASSGTSKNLLRWTVWLYMAAWVVTGAWAFWTGLNHPNALPALTSVGQAWLGLSVASAYAYLGLNP